MYNFDEVVDRRGTQCAKWDSIDKDLFPMWVADMDFPAPPPVLKALRERVEHGIFGYGIADDLPPVICNWLREEFKVAVEEEWVVLLPSIVSVLKTASRLRGGPVMINTPNYNCLLDAPLKAGKETILSPLKKTGGTFEHYEMDFDDMQKKAGPGKNLFYLCNPHNPVGRVYSREELLELSRFARKNNMVVVSDEVHCGITFDRPHIPWFSVDEYSGEQGITIIGPAKTFNIPGLPSCFAVVPNKKLREEFINICCCLSEPGVLSVIAAKAAFGESREWKNAMVEYLRQNRDFLESRLREAFPAASLTHVEGTYLQWVDFRPLGIEFPFEWLKEKPKILASDGKIFGKEFYVRLNFGMPRPLLEKAINRIEECVRKGHSSD